MKNRNLKIIVDTGSWSHLQAVRLEFHSSIDWPSMWMRLSCFLWNLYVYSIFKFEVELRAPFAIMWLNIRFLFWLMAAFTGLILWFSYIKLADFFVTTHCSLKRKTIKSLIDYREKYAFWVEMVNLRTTKLITKNQFIRLHTMTRVVQSFLFQFSVQWTRSTRSFASRSQRQPL